jgi:colanic acid biosynthesis glycosyl transferase WcaI
MKILLLNQCFYPDVAATGQYLTDLALGLNERGHQVTVITADRAYDDATIRFPRRERWQGIEIKRLRTPGWGKQARWRRGLNFGSFLVAGAVRLALEPGYDVVVALTSPPLISYLASLFVRLRGGRLYCWIMDLNPDEAVAAGWLKASSVTSRVLARLLRRSLEQAEKVIVLDRFMKERVLRQGIDDQKVLVSPPWILGDEIAYDPAGREAFRSHHQLGDKFVVMYAGNHSPCHPLATLLEAAERLERRSDIAFCFVGGGSEQERVRHFAAERGLKNISCLGYQPRAELPALLSAADLHVVVMGEPFVGIVHPCKIYNALAVGAPILYIGPRASHITDIAQQLGGSTRIYQAGHSDADAVVSALVAAREESFARSGGFAALELFSREMLLARLLDVIESAALAEPFHAVRVSQTPI